MEKKEPEGRFSSLLPILLIGGAVIFFMQYFGKDDAGTADPGNGGAVHLEDTKGKDFQFKKGAGTDTIVNNGHFQIHMSGKGGRIERFYLLNHDSFRIPEQIVKSSSDETERKLQALEVTRGNGMDFQPHIYATNNSRTDVVQIANPPVNDALFEGRVDGGAGGGISNVNYAKPGELVSVQYRLPLNFDGHRLELLKILLPES